MMGWNGKEEKRQDMPGKWDKISLVRWIEKGVTERRKGGGVGANIGRWRGV